MSGLAMAASLTLAPEVRAQDANAAALAKKGKTLFANRGCSACHAIGKTLAGPDLAGVTSRRTREWLDKFLADPGGMLATDSTAMALLQEFNGIKMPNMKLTPADIEALLAHIDA